MWRNLGEILVVVRGPIRSGVPIFEAGNLPSYVAGRDLEAVVGGLILSSVSNGAADGGAFNADVDGSVDANEGFPSVLVAGRAGAAADRARANGAATDGGNVADNAVGLSDGSLADGGCADGARTGGRSLVVNKNVVDGDRSVEFVDNDGGGG
jgi:hypothetical protein